MAHAQLTPTDLRMTPEDVQRTYRGFGDDIVLVYDIVRRCTLRALSAQPLVGETISSWRLNDWIFHTFDREILVPGWLEHDDVSAAEYSQRDPLIEVDAISVLATRAIDKHAGMSIAELLQAMALLGIGRPSTYASTFDRLIEKKYVSLADGTLSMTDEGRELFESLRRSMPMLADVSFTALVERGLDAIASAETAEEADHRSKVLLQSLWDQLNSKGYYVSEVERESSGHASKVVESKRVADFLIPQDHPLRAELACFESVAYKQREILDTIALNTGRRVSVYKVFALVHIGSILGAKSSIQLSELLEFDIRARWFVDYPLDRSAWPSHLIQPVVDELRERVADG